LVNEVLVLYVEPLGATAQVAMAVAEQLCRRGLRVHLRRVDRAPIDGREPVVLGGATGPGAWDPSAIDYVRACRADRELHLFHTDFADGSGEVPPEVRALAAGRVNYRIPVLPDVDPLPGTGFLHPDGYRRQGETPAALWADEIADRLGARASLPSVSAGRRPRREHREVVVAAS